jgi:hypothetical protein
MFFFSGTSLNIITVSFFVYIVVNLFENMIHYNIGRFSNKETKLALPSKLDWVKIIAVTCIFALVQGLLTYYFNKQFNLKY